MTTTTSAPSDAPAPDSAQPHPRRRLALFVLLAAAFMDLVDTTVVNVALPTLRDDLGASYAATQWIRATYTLAFGLGLITGGRLGDRYGRKRVFLIGVAAFTVASALCGLAPNAEILIGSRVLQGMAAALMLPQIMATVFATFPLSERGGAAGTYGAVTGLAAVLGPVIGGLLVTHDLFGLGWRAIFLINLPIGVLAFVATVLLVPETRTDRPLRMDLLGVLLVTASLILVLYPLIQGQDSGWPAWMFVALAASPLVLVGYAVHARAKDRRGAAPFLPLRLFGQAGFAVGTVVIVLFDVALVGFTLALALTVQIGMGYSAIESGLVYIPWALGAGMAAGVIGKLIARLGRHLVSIGGIVMGGGIALTALLIEPGTSMWGLWPSMFIAGVGLGFVIGPVATVASAEVDKGDAGAASGTLNAAGQIGGAIGAALLGVIFFNVIGGEALTRALDGLGDGAEATAFLTGLRTTCWSLAGVMVLVTVLAQTLPRKIDSSQPIAH